MAGIYLIKNIVNNKVYVGSCVNSVLGRIQDHKNALRKNTHTNTYLKRSWQKHGEENFQFEIIQELDSEDLDYIYEIETAWIRYYKSHKREYGYNIREIADSNLGIKLSEETRRKISEANTGEKNGFYGRKHINKEKFRKFTPEQFNKAKELLISGLPTRKVAKETGISWCTIKDFRNGKTWANKELNWPGLN